MWLDYAIVHELRGQAGPTSTDLALIHRLISCELFSSVGALRACLDRR
jgi:hypothetical protein